MAPAPDPLPCDTASTRRTQRAAYNPAEPLRSSHRAQPPPGQARIMGRSGCEPARLAAQARSAMASATASAWARRSSSAQTSTSRPVRRRPPGRTGLGTLTAPTALMLRTGASPARRDWAGTLAVADGFKALPIRCAARRCAAKTHEAGAGAVTAADESAAIGEGLERTGGAKRSRARRYAGIEAPAGRSAR